MKNSVVVGIVVVIIIFFIVGWFIYYSNRCSTSNKENCNKKCSIDIDCKRDQLCGCINANEKMLNSSNIMVDCANYECKCINDICEDVKSDNCIKAGGSSDEYGPERILGPKKCCEGLVEIPVLVYKDGKCLKQFDTGNICSDCGNGVCEEWESICNCKEDCNNSCSDIYPDACNKKCDVDSDCVLSGCMCINKNESYYNSGIPATACRATGCKCINNTCDYA